MTGVHADNLGERKARAARWGTAFLVATAISVLFLVILVLSIVSQSFGYVLVTAEVDPASLARDGIALESQDVPALAVTLRENLSRRHLAALEEAKPLESRSREELLALVMMEIVQERPARTWTLAQSVFQRNAIFDLRDSDFPDGRLYFRSWLRAGLLANPQSSSALDSGLRGAAIGSLSTILLTLLIAFPLGVAAAVWLEEYAADNAVNRFIQLNIYNLAGVPSIIYGMLGLAVFVRYLEPLTSGVLFGAAEKGAASGRTILSASLTLALLVLPVIIINSQEALRAVPSR